MDRLLKHGAQLGLTPSEVTNALRFGRPLSETNWCSAIDVKDQALEGAKESFEAGRHLEYQCYDDAGREQGRAVISLLGWEDMSQGLVNAEHILASDGYYAWYMEHQVKDRGIYHLCGGAARHCRRKLARGDRRTVIHLDRWRLLTLQAMLETDYLKPLGIRLGEKALEEASREKSALAQRPGPAGTGLDAAMMAAPAGAFPPAAPVPGAIEDDLEPPKRRKR